MARQHKAFLLAFLLLLVSLNSHALAAGGAALRGDLNENGQIEIFDLLEMLKLIAAGTDDSRLRKLADIDRPEQGKLDIFDLLGMLRLMAGAAVPDQVYFSPAITGASGFSAAGGDTLVLKVESLGDSVDLSEIRIVIGGDTLSALELDGDSLRIMLPGDFSGGELRLLVGGDTTNSISCTLQEREQVKAGQAATVTHAGGAKVTIPAGALSTDLRVTVNELSPDAVRQLQLPLEEGERPVEFGPPGTVFDTPVTIGLPLPEGAGTSQWVEAFCFDEQNREWEPLIVTDIDNANRLVLAQTSHFSVFKARPWQPSTEVIGGISMSSIPGGGYWMGMHIFYDWRHWVELDPYQIGVYEVTRGQYRALMDSIPYDYWNPDWGTCDTDNLPVNCVNWFNAAGFCNRLSEASGLEPCYDEQSWECDFTKNGFRLPTDAEWEFACRAGTNTRYYTGDSEADLDRAAWYDGNSNYTEDPSLYVHPVGLKEPNAFGLYDMYGNVAELCQDWWGFLTEPMINPVMVEQSDSKVHRGSDYSSDIGYDRQFINPQTAVFSHGFRVARSVGPRRPINTPFSGAIPDPPDPPKPPDPPEPPADPLIAVLRVEISDSVLYTPWGFTVARAEIRNDNDHAVPFTWTCGFADSSLPGDYPVTLTIQPGTAWYRRLIVPGPFGRYDNPIPAGRHTLYSRLYGLHRTDTLELTFTADSTKLHRDGLSQHNIYGATLDYRSSEQSQPKSGVLVHIIGPGVDTYVTSDQDGIFELGGLADGTYLVAPFQLTALRDEVFVTTLSIPILKGGNALGSLSPARGNTWMGTQGKFIIPYRYFMTGGMNWHGYDNYATDVSSRRTVIDTALALSTKYPPKTEIQGMTMVSLPGGSFIMGENESGWSAFPTPEHKVTLDPFQMGAYEVTRAQYSQVMGTTAPAQQDRNKPAYVKHWEEAARFCNRLSRLAGFQECYDTTSWKCDFAKNGFRLPTEAEWECAARGGRQYPYATFNGLLYHSNVAPPGQSLQQANYVMQTYMANASHFDLGRRLVDVGRYPPNPFGLYDMCGNAAEFCNDRLDNYYYSRSPEKNPAGPDDRVKLSENWSGTTYYYYAYVSRGGHGGDDYIPTLTYIRRMAFFPLEEYRQLVMWGSAEDQYEHGFRVARRP